MYGRSSKLSIFHKNRTSWIDYAQEKEFGTKILKFRIWNNNFLSTSVRIEKYDITGIRQPCFLQYHLTMSNLLRPGKLKPTFPVSNHLLLINRKWVNHLKKVKQLSRTLKLGQWYKLWISRIFWLIRHLSQTSFPQFMKKISNLSSESNIWTSTMIKHVIRKMVHFDNFWLQWCRWQFVTNNVMLVTFSVIRIHHLKEIDNICENEQGTLWCNNW